MGDKTTQARAKKEILALGGQTRMKDGELIFFLPNATPPKPQP
ncbi:MAG: hypothetical protein RBJ76_25550 [Stenomitos frigidus ULC029]